MRIHNLQSEEMRLVTRYLSYLHHVSDGFGNDFTLIVLQKKKNRQWPGNPENDHFASSQIKYGHRYTDNLLFVVQCPIFLSVSGAISSLVKLKILHCTKKARKKACLVGTCTFYNNHIIGYHTNVNLDSGFTFNCCSGC